MGVQSEVESPCTNFWVSHCYIPRAIERKLNVGKCYNLHVDDKQDMQMRHENHEGNSDGLTLEKVST